MVSGNTSKSNDAAYGCNIKSLRADSTVLLACGCGVHSFEVASTTPPPNGGHAEKQFGAQLGPTETKHVTNSTLDPGHTTGANGVIT